MKKALFFTVYFIASIFNLQAQSEPFAPVGTKWYYRTVDYLGPLKIQNVVTSYCLKDTLIQGKLCSKIFNEYNLCYLHGNPMYIYKENEQAYFWNNGNFLLLHDYSGSWDMTYMNINKDLEKLSFSVKSRGTLKTTNNKDVEYQQVSISYLPINGDSMKPYRVATLFKEIGFSYHIFPKPTDQPCDPFKFVDTLLCYENSKTGLLKFTTGDCDRISSTENQVEASAALVHVHFAPTTEQLVIQSNLDFPEGSNLVLFDSQGKILKDIPLPSGIGRFEINASELSTGIYFWQFAFQKQKSLSGKVMVH